MRSTNPSSKKWAPPFCPNADCAFHGHRDPAWAFVRTGYYRRQTDERRIQRFRCSACQRSFSTQTFSTDYWQKIPGLEERILTKTVGCMANRQIARDLGVHVETVTRRIGRLARHCLLFHCRQLRGTPPPAELVIDGFESFEWSQYFPIHHHVAVGKDTDFFYYFTESPLRRKGRMTAVQKARRSLLERRLGRPDPKAIEKDMREVLQVVLGGRGMARVYSDDHPAYRRSIDRLSVKIDHRVTPGSAHRDRRNSLWEVNLLDLLIRHSSANHKRETIAWSKRRQGSAERLLILLVWRNYMKRRREKVGHSPTPAMAVGIAEEPLTPRKLLSCRLFRKATDVPNRWAEYYDRAVRTAPLGRQRRHDLGYAY